MDYYCIHRNKNIAGLAHNEVPVNFLILLALKTLKSVEPGMPVDFLVEERYKRILKMARDFLLVLQLASPSVLEDVYVTPANLNAYICNNMMFDKMVIPFCEVIINLFSVSSTAFSHSLIPDLANSTNGKVCSL